ncbi:hypothetical protein Mfer_1076 [Methanothermus fervidus DSM 2088]|uniref:Uncharacterized protein n=1 Tax=Methanothermus fervidus (strain ATCC 43054 / DSM 2088 / JCM 10308 / V24 S) TaxID=523846 RepID=E3GWA5_METFV|nr:hypothetical protein [Methanothermus fervidus]ADP77870.1 hypothetical protein Mfer_1076 [Methanothermus fervidus DSM 2088]
MLLAMVLAVFALAGVASAVNVSNVTVAAPNLQTGQPTSSNTSITVFKNTPCNISATITNTTVNEVSNATLVVDNSPVNTTTVTNITTYPYTYTYNNYTFTQTGNHTVTVMATNSTNTVYGNIVNVTVVDPPYATLSNLTVTPTSGIAPLTITATCNITNTGGLAWNYTAFLNVNGTPVANQTITVPANSTLPITFTYTLNQLSQIGTNNINITVTTTIVGITYTYTTNNVTVTVSAPPTKVYNVTVTAPNLQTGQPTSSNTTITVFKNTTCTISATITNDLTDTKNATLVYDGNALWGTAFQQGCSTAGVIWTYNQTYQFSEVGNHTVSVWATNGTTVVKGNTVTVTVLNPPYATLSNLTVTPTSGIAPLTITATCNITNTGGLAWNYTAFLNVNGTPVANQTITVPANSTLPITFTYTLNQTGTYNIYVYVNATIAGQPWNCTTNIVPVTVGMVALGDITVSPTTIYPGQITVAVPVTSANFTGYLNVTINATNVVYNANTTVNINAPTPQTITYYFYPYIQSPGTYTLNVTLLDNNLNMIQNKTMNITVYDPNYVLSNLVVTPTSGVAPLNITATANFTNKYSTPVNVTAILYIDGSAVANQTITVPANSTLPITFNYPNLGVGTHTIMMGTNVTTILPTSNVTVKVYDPNYVLSNLVVTPTSGVAPLNITATANFTNKYSTPVNVTATLYVNGAAVASRALTVGNNTTVPITFTYTLTQAGTYNVTIGTNVTDVLPPVTVTVTTPANFTLSNLTVTPTSGVAPLTITATAKVTNTGGTAGNYTATLYVNNNAVNQTTVTVGPGNSTTVSLSYTLTQAGTYNVTIGNLTPVTVNVTTPVVPTPTPVVQNKTFSIILRNTGTSTITFKYYISVYTNPVNGTKVYYKELTITLNAGQETTIDLGKYPDTYAVSTTAVFTNTGRNYMSVDLYAKYNIEGCASQVKIISKDIPPRTTIKDTTRFTNKNGTVDIW